MSYLPPALALVPASEISQTDMFVLAAAARSKLIKEACSHRHDMRVLIGHGKLLDNVLLSLAKSRRQSGTTTQGAIPVPLLPPNKYQGGFGIPRTSAVRSTINVIQEEEKQSPGEGKMRGESKYDSKNNYNDDKLFSVREVSSNKGDGVIRDQAYGYDEYDDYEDYDDYEHYEYYEEEGQYELCSASDSDSDTDEDRSIDYYDFDEWDEDDEEDEEVDADISLQKAPESWGNYRLSGQESRLDLQAVF
ncbi:hypothetical protein AWJ20_1416 [Sugiyamaella lignohabitans]|uniref:Uncharacterized protein n=1 Tax=Sugiyamaella lignohabitans TaxID=796027 RepID=A0A167DPE3_9ASCO|nr:uncharacterized protein AWJ20_1416 [Sugiyamaella lignohabitans]ANB13135.1 hypothetical protein AWJ20_1416 [Sugiyamaella lignohabitans]